MMDWMPIETAPEGGYFLSYSKTGWIGVIKRSDPEFSPYPGWFEDETTEYVDPNSLSHWMPLPAPPTN